MPNNTFLTQTNDYEKDASHSQPLASRQSSYEHKSLSFEHLDGDEENQSDSARLYIRMRQLQNIDAEFAAAKQRYHDRMKAVDEGEESYNERHAGTVAYLRRFRQLMAETDGRRLRAERKEVEERRAKEDKIYEIEDQTKSLNELIVLRNQLQKKFNRMKMYRHYLESVLHSSDAYNEVDELLNRYAILHSTNEDLSRMNEACLQQIEHFQLQYKNGMKNSQTELLLLNSNYAKMLRQTEEKSLRLTMEKEDKEEKSRKRAEQQRYHAEVSAAIRNLYNRLMSTDLAKYKAAQRRAAHQALSSSSKSAQFMKNQQQLHPNQTPVNTTLDTLMEVLPELRNMDASINGYFPSNGSPTNDNQVSSAGNPASKSSTSIKSKSTSSSLLLPINGEKDRSSLFICLETIQERLEDLRYVLNL